MKLFGYRLQIVRDKPQPSIVDELIATCEKVTTLWEEARAQRAMVNPWIDWQSKEVFVRALEPRRIKVEETSND